MGQRKKVVENPRQFLGKVVMGRSTGEYTWKCLDGKTWLAGTGEELNSCLFVDIARRIEAMYNGVDQWMRLSARAVEGNICLERRVREVEKQVVDLGKALVQLSEGLNSHSRCILRLTKYLYKKGGGCVPAKASGRRPRRRA